MIPAPKNNGTPMVPQDAPGGNHGPISECDEPNPTTPTYRNRSDHPAGQSGGGRDSAPRRQAGLGPRAVTISPARACKEERARIKAEAFDYPPGVDRPKHRGECPSYRPCPFVSCEYHIYLDVNQDNGSIKLNFPDREVWELTVSCVWDVADQGGITLEEVGKIINLTRERVRQIELKAMERLRERTPEALRELLGLAEQCREWTPEPVRRLIAKEEDDHGSDSYPRCA